MKTKFLLPMIAMMFAIGISFASVESNASSAIGFIQTDEGWEQVDVGCETGSKTCRMYYSSDPNTIYVVHDAPGGNPLKSSNSKPFKVLD